MLETTSEPTEASSTAVLRADSVVIGLVNNMPDAALEATERQFRSLLTEASSGPSIRLRLFSFHEPQRSEAAREFLRLNYEDIHALWTADLDGLIVTGAQPRAQRVSDEPCWANLTKIVEWADDNTTSAIWSCLAAHIAVRHLDGIERRRFERKLSGVYECVKMAEHALVCDVPRRRQVPHSRYYGLAEQELVARDYQILSGSTMVGADLFTREQNSLFVFVHGHPEYEPDTLFREYRRDVRAFVAGEKETCPELPYGYFNEDVRARFVEFQEKLRRTQVIDPVLAFPRTDNAFPYTWRQPAVRLYSNWLAYLVEGKRRKLESRLLGVESSTA